MIMRKDLTDIGDKDYKLRASEFMQCQDCGEIIGGTRGDYFMVEMDKVFSCGVCESTNIALACNITTTKIIKQ